MAGEGTPKNVIGGYAFEDEQIIAQATKELEGIKYIQSKINRNSPEMVLQMYRKLIEEKMFETPVGYGYLRELQEYLTTNPSINKVDILPIPIAKQKTSLLSVERPVEKSVEKPVEKTPPKSEKKVEIKERNVNYKTRFRGALVIIVVLVVIVAAMYAITATTNNPTILNYENQIIDKHAAWEQQLDEREKTLRQREEDLRAREEALSPPDASAQTDTEYQ